MGGGLGLAASRALVISLVFPGEKSGADTAISRGMLGDPAAAAGLQSRHSFRASLPINSIQGFKRESVVAHPPYLSYRVHDDAIQVLAAGGCNFDIAIPDRPALVVDGDVRGLARGEKVKQMSPVLVW